MRIKKTSPALAAVVLVFLIAACVARPGKDPGRDIDVPATGNYAQSAPAFDGLLQVIAFNVERGFFWEDVVSYIEARREEIPATVALISEADRNHSRTGDIFVADKMAKALGMNMVFVTEYVEYNDQTPENQGDHGNAVLSPFPMSDITVIRHTTTYSWQNYGYLDDQPRFGERVAIGATIELGGGKKVRVYSCHLESNAETIGKWIQMKQIVDDANDVGLPAVIGGDFNEVPGGLMFAMLPLYGVSNAFSGDLSPTGSCRPAGDRAKCRLKIDWIVDRDLELVDSQVDYPLNSKGGILSDHAPVRAIFKVQ